MQLRQNAFKDALRASRPQIGLWVGLADAYVTELLATAGFDWLGLDAEHAPNDPRSILAQLQAMAPYPVHAVVRTASGDATLIKQYLDIGAQTLLIPMVGGSGGSGGAGFRVEGRPPPPPPPCHCKSRSKPHCC